MNKSAFLNLAPGDRIIVPKSLFGAIQHHAIYAGNGWFFENKNDLGVVCTHETAFFAGVKEITAIHKFKGNSTDLYRALQRAESLLGHSYDFWNFNCEHYATYVLTGQRHSLQVETAKQGGGILLVLGIVAAIASEH